MPEYEKEISIEIIGRGDSFWGESGDTYLIKSMIIDEEHLQLFGPSTKWYQYTDTGIEKQVKASFLKRISKITGRRIKNICWSEQGLQPDYGWDFDVIFY